MCWPQGCIAGPCSTCLRASQFFSAKLLSSQSAPHICCCLRSSSAGAGLRITLCWTSSGSCPLLPSACWDLSKWCHNHLMLQSVLPISSASLLKLYSAPLSRSLTKLLNSPGPSTALHIPCQIQLQIALAFLCPLLHAQELLCIPSLKSPVPAFTSVLPF